MGVYALNLLRALARAPRAPDITLLVDSTRPDPAGLPSGTFPVIRARGGNEPWWEQIVMPRLVLGFDLLHAPANGGPWRCPVPLVLTLHDAIFLRPFSEISAVPSFRQWLGHVYRTRVYPGVARRAAAVITVSEASRADIEARIGVDPGRIAVTHEAVSESFASAVVTPEADVRLRYALPGPFMLAMGAYERRKNIPLLFRALARVAATRGGAPLLALAGAENLEASGYRAQARASGVDALVRFLPYIPEEDLKGLQAAAVAFLMPSRQEGFGLPLLEAMCAGAPVLASAIPAHAETAGGAADLLDVDDQEAWAAGIGRLLDDPGYREGLRARGAARVGEFSWARTAAGTMAVWSKVVAGL